MRILHVISSISLTDGGPTAAIIGLCRAQINAGLKVSVVTSFREMEAEDGTASLQAAGVEVHRIGPTRGPFRSHPTMRQSLQQLARSADTLHIHALWEEIQHQAAVVARDRRIPYIFRPCGMLDPWSLRQNRWKKKLYMAWRLRRDLRCAAAIHYTTKAERDLASALNLGAPSIVEPNGVDLDAFRELPVRGAFRQRFGIAMDRPLVLFLSRVHPKKGLDLLVPAFARVAAGQDHKTDPILAIVGPDSGGYRAEVEALIAAQCIGNRVIWTGMLEGAEKVQAYADSDLYVLPSYQENFGIVVAEAMAAGLPVIISDKVNLDRDVLAAGAGAVVPTRVGPLAEAIGHWLADSDLRRQAGNAGRQFAFQQFSWDSITARWIAHYTRLIDDSPGRPGKAFVA